MSQYPNKDYKVNTIFLRAVQSSYDQEGHCYGDHLDDYSSIDLGREVEVRQIPCSTC